MGRCGAAAGWPGRCSGNRSTDCQCPSARPPYPTLRPSLPPPSSSLRTSSSAFNAQRLPSVFKTSSSSSSSLPNSSRSSPPPPPCPSLCPSTLPLSLSLSLSVLSLSLSSSLTSSSFAPAAARARRPAATRARPPAARPSCAGIAAADVRNERSIARNQPRRRAFDAAAQRGSNGAGATRARPRVAELDAEYEVHTYPFPGLEHIVAVDLHADDLGAIYATVG